ncbi:hypothetical protein EC973_003752 [Apophysomyces ossiformis]|uniref:Uncharacterized protein n=1 Tax=Apophysomyces ossiformis TaxID=679940 RepID=A0A8H7BGV4_9FUNG|nr:hypothetical protein EC973_003752 [Apophysomyces ossiformis]
MDYFRKTSPKAWKFSDAIKAYAQDHPQRQDREIIGLVKKDLREIAKNSGSPDKVSKATELLQARRTDENKSAFTKKSNSNSNAESSGSNSNAIAQQTSGNVNDFRYCNFEKSTNTFNMNIQGSATRSGSQKLIGQQEEGEESDKADGEDQETNDDNDLPLRPPMETATTTNIRAKDFREKVFQLATNAVGLEIKPNLMMDEAAQLQSYIKAFNPQSLGERLDLLAARLVSCNLEETSVMVALKYENPMALSRVLYCLNPSVHKVYKHMMRDPQLWESASAIKPDLPRGLKLESKRIFSEVIERCRGEDGKLNKKLLDIAVCKKKIELLECHEEPEPQLLQVLDILSAIANNFPEKPCNRQHMKGPSETTFYRKFAQILDVIMRDSRLEIDDGERVCQASKDIANRNMRFNGGKKQLNAFGRRIDLILASSGVEFSTSEWKRDNVTLSTALKQQCKNVRMNKAILTNLLSNPIPHDVRNQVFSLGMDWTGSVGYIFCVQELEDAYVAKPICTVNFPRSINEISDFLPTLDSLFVWKNHHEQLMDILLPAINNRKSEEFLGRLVYSGKSELNADEIEYSPNVFFTPSKKRRCSAVEEDELSDLDC